MAELPLGALKLADEVRMQIADRNVSVHRRILGASRVKGTVGQTPGTGPPPFTLGMKQEFTVG